MIGGPLFVIAFLIEGATRAGYDPLRHPVSSLALGPYGWTQIANFVVTGLLMLLFAHGQRRALHAAGRRSTWGPLLVGTYAIGLIGAGVFVTDPVGGYPPGTPVQGVHTWHGDLHDFPFSLLVFAALAAACFVFARRFAGWGERGWAVYSAVTGVLVVIGFFLSGQAFSQVDGLGGLLQRLTIAAGWGWLTLLAIHLRTLDRMDEIIS
ncbi:DUF998 domain-containing protein [Nonomuraea guangzhouensis]|uniref:DUF998 domain-containing protein n=1 Tax=Nonomuraea guangzhouensis TaxID=1291555 RepID=A0ABW4GP12_9ACTN|nr:DUF998 domain-containing protein [Nonomuraea guangzhouensis]